MNVEKPRNVALGVVVETVNPQELYQVLVYASSQDPSQVQSSSKRLKEMLDMLGTFDALQEIAVQRTVPTPIRQQAIIQFKNGALGHWRSRKVLSNDHRDRIRARTLTLLDEVDDTISQCNEIVVSKIARQDFPSSWPDLFDNLVNTIDARLTARYSSGQDNAQDALILRRSLGILNAVVKEFASMKMLNGMKIMANLVQALRDRIYGYYTTLASTLLSTLNPDTILTEKLLQDITITHLLYKALVKVAIWSWQRIDKYSKEEATMAKAWQSQLFSFSYNYIRSLFGLRKDIVIALNRDGRLALARRPLQVLINHVRAYGKYFRRLEQLDASRFVDLPQCGDLVLFYWSQVVDATGGPTEFIADTLDAVYPTRFLVQGMVLFKDSLSQWAPKRRDGSENPNTLSREFVQNAAKLLITRFMPLNPTDLENWLADPEEWLNLEDKENDQWEFEIRPCSERVLLQLTNHYSDYVVPLLSESFKDSTSALPYAATPAVDLNSVIRKEALYCALGRCAHRLKGVIPFNQWLQGTLSVETKEAVNPGYPIMKRRIAWLIGKWVSEDCASPANPLIWAILVHLLTDRGPSTDTVVRLTAATALKDCMDTVEFSVDYFLPHLPATISELVRLIGEAETFESKRRVDNALNVVIEQTGSQISPFVPIIVQPLPQLWISAGDDWLFKASLLVTVTKLIEAIKDQSMTLGAVVVPLVRESLAPISIVHLDDDGLTLWLAALRNTTTIASVNGAPALLELIPDALELLAKNMDLLGTVISIVESYILLDAPVLVEAYGVNFFQAFTAAIQTEGLILNMKDLLVLMNLFVQLTPSGTWATLFHSSGLFAWILNKLVENETSTMMMTEFVYLFSRIVMADPQAFLQLISAAAVQLNQKESYLVEGLLDQWWGKFDNMGEPRHRKLTAMGIASFLSTGRKEVLERLPTEIFNLWLDVFGEMKEAQSISNDAGGEDSPPPLRRYWDVDEAPSWFYQNTEGTPEYGRRKAVYERDPVRTIHLSSFVAEKLQEAERNADPKLFQNAIAKADPAVFRQIQAEVFKQ
ncbi:ARM repeat-containing protein [Macrolepiota fuliginosa MF-IS2]|uniref:ARM repeat-containing protein n=1 Tax=Macrolepiota fuliginosa MF-IS2 TaxID=1400762 RepID=A0A9P5XL15_9AGAR|nr:ARM repeat-containing protein [Macrolepiota fuliginosa MF-IS2]